MDQIENMKNLNNRISITCVMGGDQGVYTKTRGLFSGFFVFFKHGITLVGWPWTG